MNATQLKLHFDFDLREITLLTRGPLDVKPTAMKLPFGVLKAAASKVLQAEAEDELTVLQEAGKIVNPEQKVVVE